MKEIQFSKLQHYYTIEFMKTVSKMSFKNDLDIKKMKTYVDTQMHI